MEFQQSKQPFGFYRNSIGLLFVRKAVRSTAATNLIISNVFMSLSRKKLLVSVRNPNEAKTAITAGVDILDIKEPANGALGRADWETLRAILSDVPDHQQVSAAMGELHDLTDWLNDHWQPPVQLGRLDYTKCGLAGMARQPWRERSAIVWNRFRQFSRPVAVAYADSQNADSPPSIEVLKHAVHHHVDTFLIDTFEKKGRDVFDYLKRDELPTLINIARRNQIQFVLAGSISFKNLDLATKLDIDFIGVRGLVCQRSRRSEIVLDRVLKLKTVLQEMLPHPANPESKCSLNS